MPDGARMVQHASVPPLPTSAETYCTLRMRVPSSWSLSPAAVTVKSTTSTLALSSGLKCGLGSSVVQYSLKPLLTSTCWAAHRQSVNVT